MLNNATDTGGPARHALSQQQIREDSFIFEECAAPLPGLPEVTFLRCRFMPARYDDSLFARYDLPFPRELQHAVASRKAEHLAGRYLCKKIMQEHALPQVVPIGAFREPVWPSGWTGSITHSTGVAMSCLGRKSDVALLGIDFESWLGAELASDIVDTIIDRHERQTLSSGPWQFPRLLSLVFSAKESFYKAAFPLVEKYFDFHCVRMIGIDYPNGRFRFQVMDTLAPSIRAGREFVGSFRCEPEGIVTWVAERPGSRDTANDTSGQAPPKP